MAAEAAALRKLDPERLAVKIPCTVEGLKLTRRLAAEGATTLVTAVYTPAQAYLAGEAGATVIAPYVHRWVEASGESGGHFVARLLSALKAAGSRTGILAASLKSVDEAMEVLLAGAQAVTMPLRVLRDFPVHDLTATGLAQFAVDREGLDKE
jgi:transaldolase